MRRFKAIMDNTAGKMASCFQRTNLREFMGHAPETLVITQFGPKNLGTLSLLIEEIAENRRTVVDGKEFKNYLEVDFNDLGLREFEEIKGPVNSPPR